jgi:formylglycine-generating enzyme required for sulfatase activity
VAAYASCVRCGPCSSAATTADWPTIPDDVRAKRSVSCNGGRTDRHDHPVNCVDWEQSGVFCRAQGKRLPTDEEWEWAARGEGQGRTYPWGNAAPDLQVCWSGKQERDGTCAVGSFPEGDAPGGIHDLAGNVSEWTTGYGEAGARGGHNHRGGNWNGCGSPPAKRTRARSIT